MDTPENLYDWVGGPYGGKRRHFSREFKRHAVQIVTEKGMSVGKVARELDIHPNLLHLWRRKLLAEGDRAFVRKGHATPEKAIIKGLRIVTAQASSSRATILLQRLIISNFLNDCNNS
jgi:transposase